VCGCGVPDDDVDSDGIVDCIDPKLTLCHKAGTGALVTIEVATVSAAAHFAHGDTGGACGP
jgi:hypothetical protein